MAARGLARQFGLLGISTLLAVACDSRIATPTSPTPPVVTSIVIEGLVAAPSVGQTLQLTASVVLSDGTRQDATNTVAWRSSNTNVATISATGLLTIKGVGETDVSATLDSVTSTARVLVREPVPPPVTYTITGVVHETPPTEDVEVGNARVEVVGNTPLAGQVFSADASGQFSLPPVSAPGFALKIKRPGYEDFHADIVSLPRDQHLNIGLMPERRDVFLSVSGTNDCVDIPLVSFTVNGFTFGGRQYARIPIHHDGVIHIPQTGLLLPFSIGVQGYLVQLSPAGQYMNSRGAITTIPQPVSGGYIYLVLFGGDGDLCSAWRMQATHPS